jgi:hypothetical protein
VAWSTRGHACSPRRIADTAACGVAAMPTNVGRDVPGSKGVAHDNHRDA